MMSYQLPLKCPSCPYLNCNLESFKQHIWTGHMDVSKEAIQKSLHVSIYTCSLCSVSSTEVDLIKYHTEKDHFLEKSKVFCQVIKYETDELLDDLVLDDGGLGNNKRARLDLDKVAEDNLSSDLMNNNVPAGHFHVIKDLLGDSQKFRDQPENTTQSNETSDFIKRYSGKTQTIDKSPTTIKRSNTYDQPSDEPRPRYDWSRLIARVEKKFICLLCRKNLYNGRTEVVFHAVTRHLLNTEILKDLQCFGRLSTRVRSTIGHLFVDGMRIRSGVHYKDAERVEASLFHSIELHLRYRDESQPEKHLPLPSALLSYHMNGDKLEKTHNVKEVVQAPFVPDRKFFICSGCNTKLTDSHLAYAHINDELRRSLPEFMKARSCPWSLSSRDEWVWTVPDYQPFNLNSEDSESRLRQLFFNSRYESCHLDLPSYEDYSPVTRADNLPRLNLASVHRMQLFNYESEQKKFGEHKTSKTNESLGNGCQSDTFYQNLNQTLPQKMASTTGPDHPFQQFNNPFQLNQPAAQQNLLAVLMNALSAISQQRQQAPDDSLPDDTSSNSQFDGENVSLV